MAHLTASTTPTAASTSVASSHPAITSFPRNPLTTTFSRPAECTGIYMSLFLNMVDLQSTCLPDGLSTQSDAYFSPGIACPSGYVSACHDNTGVASQTTVTCCPTLDSDVTLSCVDTRTLRSVWSTLFCTWIAPRTTSLPVTLVNNGITSTRSIQFKSPGGLNAFGVRMVYQKTDLDEATATATGSRSTGRTSDPSESAAQNPPPEVGAGLSIGATIAIGVVVPVVVLAVLAGLLAWFCRRRRRQRTTSPYKYEPQTQQTAELHGDYVHEVEGSAVDAVELPTDSPTMARK